MPIQQILSSYLLNPLGLLALLGIIPIIILYLTRPEPEKKVMPSMQFFQQKERQSKLQKALKMLKTNLILLINILVIGFIALGLAGLYLEGAGSEETVIIYDTSASMQEEHAEAVSTVLSRASTDNTVIVAGESIEVFEGLNRQAAADIVRDNEPGYYRADMAAAVQQARSYDGSVLLLSNLDVDSSTIDQYRDLGADRGLEQIDYTTENRWGFVDVGQNYVEIRNYKNSNFGLSLSVNSESQELGLEPRETKRVEIELEEGENILELPNDGFTPDNTVYIYNPEDQAVEVEYHGVENRFIDTALDVIETVEKSEEGEVVILNEENSQIYNSDKPKILMQGSATHWGEDSSREQVKLEPPYNIGFKSEVYGLNNSISDYSMPENALFAEGNVVYYNIDDDEINTEFVYPVLWKDIIHELQEPVNFESSNENIRFSDQEEPGFYEGLAVNYLDQEQSETGYNRIDGEITSSRSVQSQAQIISLLLLILLASETLLILQKEVYQ